MRSRSIKKEFKISLKDFLILESDYKNSFYNKTDYIMMLIYNSFENERNISTNFIFECDFKIKNLKEKSKRYNDKEYIDNLSNILNDIKKEVDIFLHNLNENNLFLSKEDLKDIKRLSFNIDDRENRILMEACKLYNYKNQSDFIKSLIQKNIYNQNIYIDIKNSATTTKKSIINIMNRLNYFQYLPLEEKQFYINNSIKLRRLLNF